MDPLSRLTVEAQDGNPLNIDFYDTKKAAMILRALNNKLRQLIIKTVYENRNITVTELFIKLRIEQSVASQHLSILKKAGIVSTLRAGKYVHYSVNTTRLEYISQFAKNLVINK